MNKKLRALWFNKLSTQTESNLSMGRLFPRSPLTATKFLGIFLVVTFVASCGLKLHPIQVKREVGQLNLEYELPRQNRQTKYVIAIVKPEFADLQTEQGPRPTNAFEAAMLQQARMKQKREEQLDYNFSEKFHGNYKARLVDAMKDSLQELLSKKGFKTKGPYATFDEITYVDKKTIYLASVPSIKLYFDDKITQQACSRRYCTKEGEIQITGELIYKLIEPLTGQTMSNHRINLSNFGISRTYKHQYLTESGNIGTLSDDHPVLLTNTDKVLVEAINEFFTKAMEKLHKLISREEIINFAGDVRQLKKTKRF
ncbi:HpaA family protein [Candidatus Parabeggiatoa sp. HSG14]|uniref:HpaA family protein n=1 Tax=Candidatus Parabeggiatoa sp. HSG14 TaxID=3055593 RepID=UPI0025A7B0F3|nr:HpaA family protein [Thiotrichales bacterium HSG14]